MWPPAPRLYLRQEDLPVVCAARKVSARRNCRGRAPARHAHTPGSAAANPPSALTHVFFGINVAVFLGHGARNGLPTQSWISPDSRVGAMGRQRGSVHAFGRMVAAADLRLRSRRPDSHRVQHVVPVGSGRAQRIALWTLDLRRDLSHLRFGSQSGQRGVESSRDERRRFGRDLWTGGRADRRFQARRVFRAARRTLGPAPQLDGICYF